MFKVAAVLSGIALLAGCASSSDMRYAPIDAGISKTYNAPYEQVKRLSLESVQGLNVDVKSTRDSGKVFYIEFSKPMSAFSWGEVGRVTVVDKEPISQVIVLSEKRYKVQVTGTEVDEFAQAIFDGIERALDQ